MLNYQNPLGWVVLLWGICEYHCAVGPFDSEEAAKKYAEEEGGRMSRIISIYSPS